MANIFTFGKVLEQMQMNQQFGRLHSESLMSIDTGIKDLQGINSQMLDAMSAIQQSLAPDTFGAHKQQKLQEKHGRRCCIRSCRCIFNNTSTR